MCIAILNKLNKLPFEYFENSNDNNPDGMGMAYISKGKVKMYKEMKDVKKFYQKYSQVRKHSKSPILLHFRIGTSGTKDLTNVHPFYAKEHYAMMHNGIFQGLGDKNECDTLQLAKLLNDFQHNFLDSPLMRRFLDDLATEHVSKLVFLANDGKFYIFNEKAGNWDKDEDTWFSNSSYKTESWKKYSGYGTGYSGYGYNEVAWDNKTQSYVPIEPTTTQVSSARCSLCQQVAIDEDDVQGIEEWGMCFSCQMRYEETYGVQVGNYCERLEEVGDDIEQMREDLGIDISDGSADTLNATRCGICHYPIQKDYYQCNNFQLKIATTLQVCPDCYEEGYSERILNGSKLGELVSLTDVHNLIGKCKRYIVFYNYQDLGMVKKGLYIVRTEQTTVLAYMLSKGFKPCYETDVELPEIYEVVESLHIEMSKKKDAEKRDNLDRFLFDYEVVESLHIEMSKKKDAEKRDNLDRFLFDITWMSPRSTTKDNVARHVKLSEKKKGKKDIVSKEVDKVNAKLNKVLTLGDTLLISDCEVKEIISRCTNKNRTEVLNSFEELNKTKKLELDRRTAMKNDKLFELESKLSFRELCDIDYTVEIMRRAGTLRNEEMFRLYIMNTMLDTTPSVSSVAPDIDALAKMQGTKIRGTKTNATTS